MAALVLSLTPVVVTAGDSLSADKTTAEGRQIDLDAITTAEE
jgi:hypothetical protein